MAKYIISSLVMILMLTLLIFSRLSEFELPREEQQRTLSFRHHDDVLSGTLILPADKVSPPFVVLIHGDGPQDRWSQGGYIPLVNDLVAQGIAVFSWDKPGVGDSSGNWLSQTMSDRAEEAAIVLQHLREQPELKGSRGGYLGFSQAGWVIPQASQLTKTDFIILIGAAINWRNQGIYYTGQRLQSEGRHLAEIQYAKKQETEHFDRQFTQATVALPCHVECTRQDFERRNALVDATKDISTISTPVLILMGKEDRNVDPNETLTVWDHSLPTETVRCLKQLPYATHGLLRSEWFDYQLTSQWPLWKQGLFLMLGKYAYSPNALNTISSWIHGQQCNN